MKLQKLFADEKFSAAMEVSDVGTVDPQSSGNESKGGNMSVDSDGKPTSDNAEESKNTIN